MSNIDYNKLKQLITMVQVANHYGIKLKSYGHLKKTCCLFHEEKTPSMIIYPDDKGFYCQGCGSGGSILDFVSQYENINIDEAAVFIAKIFGIIDCDNFTRQKIEDKAKQKEIQDIEKKKLLNFEHILCDIYRYLFYSDYGDKLFVLKCHNQDIINHIMECLKFDKNKTYEVYAKYVNRLFNEIIKKNEMTVVV